MIKQIEIDIKNGNKKCNRCFLVKELKNFHIDRAVNRYKTICASCYSLDSKIDNVTHEDRIKYGSTFLLLSEQKTQFEIDTERGLKVCNKCEREKGLNNFTFTNTERKKYYNPTCKECTNISVRRPKRLTAFEVHTNNGHKLCSKCKLDKPLVEFSITNHKNRKEYNCQCNPCKRDTEKKISQKDKFKIRRRKYYKQKRENDPDYKLKCNLTSGIRTGLGTNHKSDRTIKLIGCSWKFLKEYIETKFTEGMSWKNYGFGAHKFQIDHVLPCELFDFSDKRQQRICFHYTNMQPLWFLDNDKKSDILDDGRRARHLTKEEKLEYLRKKGFDL